MNDSINDVIVECPILHAAISYSLLSFNLKDIENMWGP